VGRTKKFDPEAALRAALDLFWRKGYEATSMQDLVEHVGISRASLYATFGGKHDLYLKALDRYTEETGDQALRDFARPGPVLPAVRELVRACADDPEHKGCLVTNTVVELLPGDPACGRRAEANFDRMERDIAGALVRAQAQGELSQDKDPRTVAAFLVTFVQGIRVMSKLDDRRRLDDAVATALKILH
jgi:TetR/AcrR family transcriptional regulator, transcriptional repressor for nem operon